MYRDGNVELGARRMKQAGVAAALMVNIESARSSAEITCLGFRTGSFGRMAYGIVTATNSVVTDARSLGICSPVSRALSK